MCVSVCVFHLECVQAGLSVQLAALECSAGRDLVIDLFTSDLQTHGRRPLLLTDEGEKTPQVPESTPPKHTCCTCFIALAKSVF